MFHLVDLSKIRSGSSAEAGADAARLASARTSAAASDLASGNVALFDGISFRGTSMRWEWPGR